MKILPSRRLCKKEKIPKLELTSKRSFVNLAWPKRCVILLLSYLNVCVHSIVISDIFLF
jgi:hypothetical protein